MRTQSKKTLFTAVLAMLAVAFTATFSFAAVPARAEEAPAASKEKAGLTRLLVDQNEYTSLHYFSDYSLAPSYFSSGGYIHSAMVNYAYSHNTFSIANSAYHNLNNLYAGIYSGIYENFNHYYTQLEYENIEDAFIIFEVRSYLYWVDAIDQESAVPTNKVSIFLTRLETVFSTWKTNGCKIMFINNTDEELFDSHTTFLDYVDIHISMDMFTTFHTSALYLIGEDIVDSTIFIDFAFNDYQANPAYSESKFVKYIFEPFLLKTLNISASDFASLYYGELANVLDYYNIDLFAHFATSNGGTTYSFYNYRTQSTVNFGLSDSNVPIHNGNMYAFCTSLFGDNTFVLQDFLESINQMYGDSLIDMYFYIEYGTFSYSSNASDPLNVFDFGYDRFEDIEHLTYILSSYGFTSAILYDFLDGYDLSQFDNWTGDCDVTFKPLGYGEGWIIIGFTNTYLFDHLRIVFPD